MSGQRPPFRSRRGELVKEDRKRQLLPDPLAEPVGELHAIVHRHAGHRHERTDIDRAHASVGAVMVAHVDELARRHDELERALEDRLRLTDEGDHGAVGLDPGIDVEQLDTCNRRRRFGDSRCRSRDAVLQRCWGRIRRSSSSILQARHPMSTSRPGNYPKLIFRAVRADAPGPKNDNEDRMILDGFAGAFTRGEPLRGQRQPSSAPAPRNRPSAPSRARAGPSKHPPAADPPRPAGSTSD